MERPPVGPAGAWIAALVVATAAVALYAPTVGGGFLADDVFYLRTLSVEDGALAGAFTGPLLGSRETQFYRPLPLASLALENALWGVDRAVGFRLVNLLVHLVNALLVASIAARVLARPAPAGDAAVKRRAPVIPAVLAGGLFALHPLAPEAVAWISGRFDLLATLFTLLALRLAIAAMGDGERPTGRLGSLGPLAWGLALVFFAAALGSKESSIGLPLAVAAWAALSGGAATRGRVGAPARAWAASWPFLAVAALYLALRVWALGSLVGGYRGAPLEWWQKEFWAVRMLAVLALVVPHPVLFQIPKKLTFCLLAYPALAAGAVAVLRRRSPAARRAALFAVAWLAAAVAPHLPVLALRPTLENARILYLAAAPFALLVAAVLAPGDASAERSVRLRLASLAAPATALLAAGALLAGNLAPWVEAGRTTRALRRQVVELARSLPEGRRAVVEGVPDRLGGALVLRNGEALARAPFVPAALDGRVELSVEAPPDAAPPSATDGAPAACASPEVGVFRWEREKRRLVRLECG